MNNSQIREELAEIHNLLVDVSVKGDDTIKLAQAIIKCRELFKNLTDEDNSTT